MGSSPVETLPSIGAWANGVGIYHPLGLLGKDGQAHGLAYIPFYGTHLLWKAFAPEYHVALETGYTTPPCPFATYWQAKGVVYPVLRAASFAEGICPGGACGIEDGI